jgi:hypothetical protein
MVIYVSNAGTSWISFFPFQPVEFRVIALIHFKQEVKKTDDVAPGFGVVKNLRQESFGLCRGFAIRLFIFSDWHATSMTNPPRADFLVGYGGLRLDETFFQ